MTLLEWMRQRYLEWQPLDFSETVIKSLEAVPLTEFELRQAAYVLRGTEIRHIVQMKDKTGLPLFGNIQFYDEKGKTRHLYKQVPLFVLPDVDNVIYSRSRLMRALHRGNEALQKFRQRRFQVQIPLPYVFIWTGSQQDSGSDSGAAASG